MLSATALPTHRAIRALVLPALLTIGPLVSAPEARASTPEPWASTPEAWAASPNCEDVSGVYDVLVDLPGGGPTSIELDIAQTECEVTGFVGAQTRTPIENGVVEGSTASFTFEAQNQGGGGTLEIEWVITIDGDEVTGTFSHDLFGSIEVVGSRAEPGDG